MDDLLSEFLTETNESISTLDSELVNLEQNPDNPELIDNIFRLVHTIKGTCGFLGLPRLESVAHAAENVLGKFRDRELVVTPEAVTLILASFDRIKDILGVLEATEAEPAGDDKELIEQLNVMAAGGTVTADAAQSAAASGEIVAAAPPAADTAPPADEAPAANTGEVSLDELEAAFAAAKGPEELAAEAAAAAEAEGAPAEEAAATVEVPADVAPAADSAPAAEPAAANKNESHKSSSNQTIRVNVELLENLMTMVSELVLSRNQLLQMIRGREDSEFTVPLQRLSHVTTELQEGVMKTRMQPIGNAWAKLPRIVRDLSHELGKKIDLQMNGAETELDRQVLELIKDPLTHMVRNSADHGLETTEDRLAAGKPETGKVILNAYHEGGHINIEITDDGRGIPVEKIKAKALEKGLASGADLEEMSDQRILQFIFNAGFSTAEKVTSVSGRGVGMDVVRSNIEKIGGTVDVKSVEGKGSIFTIKIPLTLAIVSALIVECAEERFAIPQLSVVELVRASKDGEHKIERINGTPVLRLRDRLLPLVYLDKVLGLRENMTAPGDDEGEAANTESMEEAFIVVSQIGSQTFGLVVDQVFDTEEIVVKPVAPILRDTKVFSGNTILGDGTVIMILDPNGISNMHVSSTIGEDHAKEDAKQRAYADDLVALLVFHVGNQEPKAVPLSLVARLEEVDVKDIEHSDGQMMVQYRGRLMPLVKFDSSYELRSEGRQPMLVFADGERSMGLIVDEIVDIVEEALDIELVSKQERLIGSAVVDGKATEIIDVAYYLTSALGDWFSEKGASSGSGVVEKNRILLVDDSPFFRNMLVPLLNVAGYQVTTAGTADEALELRDSGQHFDVIISDIEMPGMNGFEFAEAVKTDARWDETPLVALSSHTTPQDFDRGRQAGFVDYVSKTNRDALLDVLSQTLAVTGGAA